MADYTKNYTNLKNFLPSVLSTEINKNIFENLYNRFTTKDESIYVSGSIGSTNSKFKNILESSVYDQTNQFQNVPNVTIGTKNYYIDFDLFFNKLKNLGVDPTQFQQWGALQTFNFAPPIDYDKLINYQDYYWDQTTGGDVQNYITIKNQQNFTETKFLVFSKNLFSNLRNYNLLNSNGILYVVGNLTNVFGIGNSVLLFDSQNNLQLNQIVTLQYSAQFNRTVFTFSKNLDFNYTNVVSLDFKIISTNNNQFIINGNLTSILNNNLLFSTENNLNEKTYWNLSNSTYDSTLNVTYVTPSGTIPNSSQILLSLAPIVSLYSEEYNYYLNNAITDPITNIISNIDVGKIVWFSQYGLYSSSTGFTNFSNYGVFYDQNILFSNLNISAGDSLIISSGPNAGTYRILNVGQNYIGIDTPKQLYTDENVTYVICKNSSVQDISSEVPPSPTIFDIWYNNSSDILYQWTGSQWKLLVYNFSLLLTESNNRFLTNHIQTNPWAVKNSWTHKSTIISYQNFSRAQMPIIEFDSYLELSNISYYTYDWKYRSAPSSIYNDSTSSPILFEIANLSNINNNSFSFKDEYNIIFNESFGNLTTNVSIGSKIQLKGFAQNNGLYTIRNIQYIQIGYNQEYQTILTTIEPIQNLYDLPNGSIIGPQFTSNGDTWLGYDQHWLFNGINNAVSSSFTPTPNPMIDSYVNSYNTESYETNLYLYAQELHFLTILSNPIIVFDSSLNNIVLFDNYQEGDLRVYINNIRQYGNYQDIRSTRYYNYVGGIIFDNVVLTPDDVVRIELGEYALSDVGLGSIPLVSEENISGQTTNYKLFNISNYRKTEQTNITNNEHIYFNVYDMFGNSLENSSIIFDYQDDSTNVVNSFLDRRISYNSNTNDYGFQQYLSLSDSVLLFYKNIDGSLQSIWRAGNNGEQIVPQTLSNGSWDIPSYWNYNIEHLIYSNFMLSQVSEHFLSLIDSQTVSGIEPSITQNYYFIKSKPNYALGGTIKNSNGNLDLLVSALLVNNVDPLTIIDFAKNTYYSQISFVRNSLLENISTYLTTDNSLTLEVTQNNILNNILNLFVNNEKNDKWFGDSTSYVNNIGVKNWIASPAIFGLCSSILPYSDIDTSVGLYQVVNHFGARIDTTLNNATIQQILSSLRYKSNNFFEQLINTDSDSFLPGKYSTGSLLLRTNISSGTYKLYRFSSLNLWELVDLNLIFSNLILNIEFSLYNAVPSYDKLKYNFNNNTTNLNYYINYQNKFLSYCKENGFLLPFKNIIYNSNNPYTWNYYYSTITSYPSDIKYISKAASYLTLYENAFGTPYPQLEPWKLQGYLNKPNWWDSVYSSTSGTRRWNSFMWYNILNGIVPYDQILPDNINVGNQKIGQVKTWFYLPVNMDSTPTLDNILPDELLPPYWNSSNSPNKTIRSLFDPNDSDNIIIPNSDYVFGDGNINEFSWKNSIDYQYNLMSIAFLLDPINFFSDAFGSNYLPVNCLNISTDTQSVASHQSILFHGEFSGDRPVYVNGLNQWYVHYNRYYGYDGDSSLFYKLWKNWSSSLAYEFNSFIENNSFYIKNDFFDISTKDYKVDIFDKNAYKQIGFDTINVNVLSVPSLYAPNRNYGNGWSFQINTVSGNNINYFGVQNYEMNLGTDQTTFLINNYPIVSAGLNSPYNYIIIDYNHTLTLTTPVSYYSNRNYNANIEINNTIFNLSTNGSVVTSISDFISYVNSSLNNLGSLQLIDGNLHLTSQYNLSISDFGLFNSLTTRFLSISAQFVQGYLFNNYFVVDGDKTLQFQINSTITVSSSTQFNGVYTVISVYYDILTESSTIYVASSNVVATSDVIDGIIQPFNATTLPSDWVNGTEIYLSTTSSLPSPLNDLSPYYITITGLYSFKLSNNLSDLNNGVYITCYNNGSGINYVGRLKSTFKALSGETTNYSWRIFEPDTRYVKTRNSSFSVSSIQNFNNFIDGYGAYLENNDISNTPNDVDPNTGRLNSWQLEKEKFINSIYQINSLNQLSKIQYNISVDISNNRFIYSGYKDTFVNGQPILLGSNENSTLPIPFNNPFTQFIAYYMIISSDLLGFQVAASYADALNGKAIQIENVGVGTFYFELVTSTNYPSFNLNPYKTSFSINTPTGILDKIGTNSLENIFISKIYDQNYNNIDTKSFIVYRNNDNNVIKLLDNITNVYLSSFIGYISEYENILVFEDYSIDNDIIYDPFFGLNTPYFYVEFNKQSQNLLRYSFGGHILIDDVFYRNLESYTQLLRNMYGTHNLYPNSQLTTEARKSIGYNGSSTYFDALDINDQTQFLFYQGMVKNKGTNVAVNAFLNQPLYTSADLDEYWAYKVATYGDSKPKNYPQMFLEVSDSVNREARFEFIENGASPLDLSFTPISLYDVSRWYDQPDVINELYPATQFYFGVDIFSISYGQENNIRFISNYGIYIINLLEPCDGVILTNFSVSENKQVTLVNTVDYILLNALTVQLILKSASDIDNFLNLTVYSIRYNYDAHNGCEIVDKEAGVVVQKVPILNPIYNEYNPFAYSIVDYHQDNDPAQYNYYGNGNASDSGVWFDLYVDRVWFDSNNEVYVPYNDPAIFNNSDDRIFNWATLSPFATIDLYQWTKSIYPPLVYDINANNGISRKNVYQNIGTRQSPIWQEVSNLIFNYSAYEIYNLANPTTGTVQIYRNGVFDLSLDLDNYSISDYVDLNATIPNQTLKPTPQDYISIIQPPYQPTPLDIQNSLYKIDANYSVLEEINPADGNMISYYYFWVSGRTDIQYNKIKNETVTLATCSNTMLNQTLPYMIIDGLRYSNDFGFGILFGNTFDESPYDLPARYTQLIIRGLNNYITQNDRYTLRLINDYTLRESLVTQNSQYNYNNPGQSTPLSLNNVHVEWTLFRQKQFNSVDRVLWDAITSSMVGCQVTNGVPNFNMSLPAQNRILYDSINNATTSYGLEDGQIFMDSRNAINIVNSILNDPSQIFVNIDINNFLSVNNFNTPNNIINLMNSIYSTFDSSNINYIFFECLYYAMSLNLKNKNIFKTSWVALDIGNSSVNNTTEILPTFNIAESQQCISTLTFTITPSRPIPSPSPTPTVTPFATITPSVTISASPSIPVVSIVPSITPSTTPTLTVTPTIYPTASITPSVSPTISITPTLSLTPSVTQSPNPSITPQPTRTITPTITPSITQSTVIYPSVSITPTQTLTPTTSQFVLTPTPAPTVTPTPS